ncbi:HD-GYP domain-containing protein [Clostridium cadaveris]|uniref:HD-GYP domain-containing protein n=1 Tax=Clostridium cadaveris TaxID=1529 RepID=UPI0015B400AB|nr:HD domain-containing phosphohydrolase [Clostridium cadaveris]NWK11956.1 HD domain-containing protein [Clostridium cadaveris]
MILKIDSEKNLLEIYKSLDLQLIKHSENVATYVHTLYQLSLENNLFPNQLCKEELAFIKDATIYHDIGKSVYEKQFLNKRQQFTPKERSWVKHHVNLGLIVFKETYPYYDRNSDKSINIFINVAISAIGQHHEKFDGSGYPNGLKGDEISPIGQMCGLCDYYDAITTHRSYHIAFTHQRAFYRIYQERGKHFNPKLVELFLQNKELFQR